MKKGIILFLVLSLLLMFSVVMYKMIDKIDTKHENNEIVTTEKDKKEEETKLKQKLICSNISNINNDNGIKVGTNITTYNFSFEGDEFVHYKKDILIAFDNEVDYQNYCISCDNTEANDIKSITKGVEISITPSMNKYVYESINIDISKYDGEHKETKYGLDGLKNNSTLDNVIFMTRDMACYWEY